MNPSMDDRRILAEMERRLSQDDPQLVELMDALNHQLADYEQDTGSRSDAAGGHDWRWKTIVAFAVVLVAGLLLTAILSRSPSADDNHGPPNSRAPAVSTASQGRGLGTGTKAGDEPAKREGRTC